MEAPRDFRTCPQFGLAVGNQDKRLIVRACASVWYRVGINPEDLKVSPALVGPGALWTIKDVEASVEIMAPTSGAHPTCQVLVTILKPLSHSFLTTLWGGGVVGVHPHFTDEDAEAQEVEVSSSPGPRLEVSGLQVAESEFKWFDSCCSATFCPGSQI